MRSIIVLLFAVCCITHPTFAANEPSQPTPVIVEDYFKVLTPQENLSINYIMTTLGTRTALGLFLYRSKLDKAGAQIGDVHPLRFWKEVLTNPKLRGYLKNINGIVRKQFIEGYVKGLQDSQKKGTMREEYTEDFAKSVGIPNEQMQEYVKNQQWEAMLNAFFALADQQKGA